MEPETDGLEDDFPFQLGELLGSMLIFRGVTCPLPTGTFEDDFPFTKVRYVSSWRVPSRRVRPLLAMANHVSQPPLRGSVTWMVPFFYV